MKISTLSIYQESSSDDSMIMNAKILVEIKDLQLCKGSEQLKGFTIVSRQTKTLTCSLGINRCDIFILKYLTYLKQHIQTCFHKDYL